MKFNDKEFPYSFSQDRLYCDCPYKYKLRYVDGIKEPTNANLELGSAIHKLLELQYYKVNEDTVHDYSEENIKEINAARDKIIKLKGIAYFEKLLTEMYEFFKDKTILHNELRIEDNVFVNIIDVVYSQGGKIILADFKVTKKPKTINSIYTEGQLLFYKQKFIEKTEYDWDSVQVQYINILSYNSGTIVNFTEPKTLSKDDCLEFISSMMKNINKINKGYFPKQSKWCNWCYYKKIGKCKP